MLDFHISSDCEYGCNVFIHSIWGNYCYFDSRDSEDVIKHFGRIIDYIHSKDDLFSLLNLSEYDECSKLQRSFVHDN